MKIKIKTDLIKKHVDEIDKLFGGVYYSAPLSHKTLLLAINGKDIVMAAGNDEIVIRYKIKNEEEPDESFIAVVDMQKFITVTKTFKKEFNFKIEKNKAIVSYGKKRFSVGLYNKDQSIFYPKKTISSEKSDIDFEYYLRKLKHFTSVNNKTMPQFDYIHFYNKDGKTFATATDSYHLARIECNSHTDLNGDGLLLNKSLPLDKDVKYTIAYHEGHISFITDEKIVTQRKLYANYPDVDKLLSNVSFTNELKMNRFEFLNSLSVASRLLRGRNVNLFLNIDKVMKIKAISLKTSTEAENSFDDEVPIISRDEPVQVGFEGLLFKHMLEIADTDDITIGYTSYQDPFVYKNDKVFCIVMPRRI